MPTLIAAFRETHPDVALDLMEAPTARQVTALLDDRLDLAIVALPLPDGTEQHIATRTILRSALVAALPSRHPLAREPGTRLPLAALANEPWILFPASEGPGLHDRVMRACASAGFVPEVAQRAVQMETIVGLVAAGLGVALVPELFRTAGWDNVVFRTIGGAAVPYEVALAWRQNDGSPALAALLASHSGQ